MKSSGKTSLVLSAVRGAIAAAVFGAVMAIFSGCSPADQTAYAEKIKQDYSQQDPVGRLTILKILLRSGRNNNLDIFYTLLVSAREGEITIFKQAFAEEKSVKAVIYLDRFAAESSVAEALKYSQMEADGKARMVKEYQSSLWQKIDSLAPEIKLTAAYDPRALAKQLKKVYAENSQNFDPVKARSVISALKMLGEDGFAAILSVLGGEKDRALAVFAMKEFGVDAVVPILKAVENPVRGNFKQTQASKLIDYFPADDTLIIDKIIEAFRHGRFYDVKASKNPGLEESLNHIVSWWGNYVVLRFKGDQFAVRRIGEKYLPDAYRQERMIYLVASLDFRAAKPYLEKLDPNKISPKSLENLFLVCNPMISRIMSSLDKNGDVYLDDRFEFFRNLFLRCSIEQRDKKIFSIEEFPLDSVAKFYMENFGRFSDQERMCVIYDCGKGDDAQKEFSRETRDKLVEKITPLCDEKELGQLQYELKH